MFSLVIPTYNERENIKPLLDAVVKALHGFDFEVLVVDDDSPDGTGVEVLNYHSVDKRVRLLVRKKERGLSSAVIAGFNHAKGDVLGVMDADLSHNPRILPDMVKAVMGDYDLAVGARSGVAGWGFGRKLISSGAAFLARTVLGVSLSDPMSGYFVVRKSVFDNVKDELNPLGFKVLLEIYARATPLHYLEVPYIFENRLHGESKLSGKVMREYLKQLRDLHASIK